MSEFSGESPSPEEQQNPEQAEATRIGELAFREMANIILAHPDTQEITEPQHPLIDNRVPDAPELIDGPTEVKVKRLELSDIAGNAKVVLTLRGEQERRGGINFVRPEYNRQVTYTWTTKRNPYNNVPRGDMYKVIGQLDPPNEPPLTRPLEVDKDQREDLLADIVSISAELKRRGEI